MPQFCPNYDVISKKKKGLQATHADYCVACVISMGPSRAHGPSAGPVEANGLPEAHGPRGHCNPCPPLSVAL